MEQTYGSWAAPFHRWVTTHADLPQPLSPAEPGRTRNTDGRLCSSDKMRKKKGVRPCRSPAIHHDECDVRQEH